MTFAIPMLPTGAVFMRLGLSTRDPALHVANAEAEAKEPREDPQENAEREHEERRNVRRERREECLNGRCCKHIFKN